MKSIILSIMATVMLFGMVIALPLEDHKPATDVAPEASATKGDLNTASTFWPIFISSGWGPGWGLGGGYGGLGYGGLGYGGLGGFGGRFGGEFGF